MIKRAQAALAGVFLCTWALPATVVAQGAPGGAAGGGPIDIQAQEQEFSGDHVIARGNVRVVYKDSVVLAPQATLFRDPDGQPQKAIFTGHPHLIQGANKMDADTLVFEIARQGIIADGHAHSEVLSSDDDSDSKKASPAAAPAPKAATEDADAVVSGASPRKRETVPSMKPRLTSTPRKGKNGQPFDWPVAGKDDPTGAAEATASNTNQFASDPLPSKGPPRKSTKAQAPEKIITDSDHQEFEQANGKFEARGHVRVRHGDIVVKADKLQLVYGVDNKPETAVFTGNVNAVQFDNNTTADAMTYFLSTQRLQATGNVKSKVIQRANKDDAKKGGPSTGKDSGAVNPVELGELPEDRPIFITSDAQDYSRESGRISADGNVKMKYGDTSGMGPKVVVLRNEEGQAEKVLFSGRSQVSQPGKRWIGDRITFTVADRRVLAEGNTRAIILQKAGPATAGSGSGTAATAPAKPEAAPAPAKARSGLAGKQDPRGVTQ